MKTLLKSSRVFLFIGIFTAGMTACKKNKKVDPVRVDAVQGNYSGTYKVSQGNANQGANIEFSVSPTSISFTDFPMLQIVSNSVTDSKERVDAMKMIGKMKYDLTYARKLSANNNAIDLALSPKPIAFDVLLGGVAKKVVVEFAPNQKTSYIPKSPNDLSVNMITQHITIDGKALNMEPINFTFSSSKKK